MSLEEKSKYFYKMMNDIWAKYELKKDWKNLISLLVFIGGELLTSVNDIYDSNEKYVYDDDFSIEINSDDEIERSSESNNENNT